MENSTHKADGIDMAGQELLSRLLLAATAAFDEDIGKARACLARAAALLEHSSDMPHNANRSRLACRGGLAGWQARKLTNYIQSHLSEKVCVADLAREVKLSVSHFSRAFVDTFGEAPMMYVARRRMKLAQDMILQTTQPLSRIAIACGLQDQAHFTRVFKSIVGSSPRAWRRQFSSSPATISRELGIALTACGTGHSLNSTKSIAGEFDR